MKRRLADWLQRHVIGIFAVLRNSVPIIAYRNKFALVTRADDVHAVMTNDAAFTVTYEPKMRVVAGGENFFLGMGDTPTYHRDVDNWRNVFPGSEAVSIVAPLVETTATDIVERSGGELDVVADLGGVVPAVLVEQYMGVSAPTRSELIAWTSALFAYLFFPANAAPTDDAAARISATARAHIDGLIAERKASGAVLDDGIGRALAMQAEGRDGMSDADIRNNLLGIAIGAVPTTSKCVALVLDFLLDHPEHLVGAQRAARAGDWDVVNGYINECLRFNPFGPVLLRRCTQDHRVGAGHLRARTIKTGTLVAVATLSAMWDGRAVAQPTRFDPTRPSNLYLTYGAGMHTCFGARINTVQIARIVGSVIARDGLARALDGAGALEMDGLFPTHLRVTYAA
jgi:cytochrome P450